MFRSETRPRLVTVGQLTADTRILLDGRLAVGDQCTGRLERTFGGTAAIAAHNAAALELLPVVFAGHVGQDPSASTGLCSLTAVGVTIGPLLTTPNSPEVIVMVEATGERTMVSSPGAPDWRCLSLELGPQDAALFEGWHLFDDDGSFAMLIRHAKQAGAIVALDVCSASRAKDPLEHAERLKALEVDVMLANSTEATAYGLEPAPTGTTVVVHAGSAPTRAWVDGFPHDFPVQAVDPVDTTGAGDTFAAVLMAMLARGARIEYAIEAANRAAGHVVERVGPLLASHVARLPR